MSKSGLGRKEGSGKSGRCIPGADLGVILERDEVVQVEISSR